MPSLTQDPIVTSRCGPHTAFKAPLAARPCKRWQLRGRFAGWAVRRPL